MQSNNYISKFTPIKKNYRRKYIIPRFGHYFLFILKKVIYLTYTLSFYNIYKYVNVFIFKENKNN